jgi:hypothetical protein
MNRKIVNNNSHFLNDEQKNIKHKIMQDLMEAFYSNLEKDKDKFLHHPQAVSDIVCSCLSMFNRDVIVHFLQTFNIKDKRKDFMKSLFEKIRDEVNHKIKNSMI